jgi:hypothetical protein
MADPRHPQAFPAEHAADLLGQIQVRLCAEDGHLVAYGFGGQRVAIPASKIRAVRWLEEYRTPVGSHREALLILGYNNRILLRAGGRWDIYGDVARVCRAAGAPSPTRPWFPPPPRRQRWYSAWTAQTARGMSKATGGVSRIMGDPRKRLPPGEPPLLRRAPGYRRLRTRPRTTAARRFALVTLGLATVAGAALAGTLPAQALPQSFGAVRLLLGIAGALLAAAGGGWLFTAVCHVAMDAARWAAASRQAGTMAPPDRFFHRRERSGKWLAVTAAGLIVRGRFRQRWVLISGRAARRRQPRERRNDLAERGR